MTLKDAVLTALNTGRSMSGQYSVTYDVTTKKLVIGNLDATATFHIYPIELGSRPMQARGTQIRLQEADPRSMGII